MSKLADIETVRARDAAFAALHQGRMLVLPNAWDAASAKAFEAAGVHAKLESLTNEVNFAVTLITFDSSSALVENSISTIEEDEEGKAASQEPR
jgi:2-methylisocitrate lyase-like PEP mutase family enzyme